MTDEAGIPVIKDSDNVTYFSHDIRYYRGLYIDDAEVWPCSLSTDLTSNSATLSLSPSDNFPDDYTYWIIDGTDTTDLTATGTYNIDITSEQASFQIMVKGYVPPAPVITIISPVNGQVFNTGDEMEIQWDLQNEVITYNLSYSTDGGINWSDIAVLNDAEASEYIWSVPNFYSTNTLIKVLGNGLGGVVGS